MNPFTKKSQIHMNQPVRDQEFGSPYDDRAGGPGELSSFGPGDIVEVIDPGTGGWSLPQRGTWNYSKANLMIGPEIGAKKKLDRNTYLIRISEDEIGVKFHNTFIVRYFSDETFILNTGGWNTVTTRQRMDDFSPVWVKGIGAGRDGNADKLVISTPWGDIPAEDVRMSAETGMPVDWEEQEMPPHAKDYAGQQGEILYRDDAKSSVHRENVWKVLFQDGEVGYYRDHNLKMVQPFVGEHGERVHEKSDAPELSDEEDIIIARKNPFKRAQELKNDIYNEETEQPSDVESDTGHNLEFVDRSDDKKNERPTHHQGPVKSANIGQFPDYQEDDEVVLTDDLYGHKTGERATVLGAYPNQDGSDWEYEIEIRTGPNSVSRFKTSGENLAPSDETPKFQDWTDPRVDVLDEFNTNPEMVDNLNRGLADNPVDFTQLTPAEMEERERQRADEIRRKMWSSRNPFRRGQTDHETAETGHIGNSDPVEKPTGGGRSPGDLDNPTPNNPFAHDTSQNSKGEQVA